MLRSHQIFTLEFSESDEVNSLLLSYAERVSIFKFAMLDDGKHLAFRK